MFSNYFNVLIFKKKFKKIKNTLKINYNYTLNH